jgi:hypothetical protein
VSQHRAVAAVKLVTEHVGVQPERGRQLPLTVAGRSPIPVDSRPKRCEIHPDSGTAYAAPLPHRFTGFAARE